MVWEMVASVGKVTSDREVKKVEELENFTVLGSFTIGKQTDSLELGIRLIQATTNTGTDIKSAYCDFQSC